MDAIDTTMPLGSQAAPRGATSFGELGSDDFLKLLITQLTTQDPMEPTGNEELLRQIASIREIELSTSLTESLGILTGQQRFSSASSLIGQYVTGAPGPNGTVPAGIVRGVRFEADGQPILQLADGSEMSLEQLSTIEPPLRAGEALIGRMVVGVDRRNSSQPELVEGVVTAAQLDDQGEVLLELDTGQSLRLRDFVSLAPDDA